MLREKQALKQPSSSPAQRKTKTTEISSRRKMLSYFCVLYSFSKRWRDVEERDKREYENTVYPKEMFMKIPSSVSWHHLVVNISCFRDQSFLWMVLIVLRLSWYVSESCVLSPFSCVRLFGTSQTITCQASLFMELSRQEYWSGLSCPPPEDLPHPGTEPRSPLLQADSLWLSYQGRD